MDAAQGSLYAVQGFLGHSSTRVTGSYPHSSRTHIEAAVTALGEYREKGRRENVRIDG